MAIEAKTIAGIQFSICLPVAMSKLLFEKGIITKEELSAKVEEILKEMYGDDAKGAIEELKEVRAKF